MTTFKEIASLLSQGATSHASWLKPSQKTLEKLSNLDSSKDKELVKLLDDGIGVLMKISSQERGGSENENFHYDSHHVKDAPAGTIVGLHGSVIHAGTGAASNDVRSIVFWTYAEKAKYNNDTQHTKVTVMATIVRKLWSSKDNRDIRLDLLKLLCHCFVTTDTSHQKTCPGCFINYGGLRDLLTSINDCPNNEKDTVESLLKGCLHDEFLNLRAGRAQRRDENKTNPQDI